jgi:tetrapyrrole methylase family protein/MazG family protein
MQAKFQELWDIVKKLRGREGCPWDRKQDHESLLPYLIEEVYEVVKAVEEKDHKSLKEELGDLLFLIFSYISIGEEKGLFTSTEVIQDICKKMKERHPHVFSDKKLKTPQEVVNHWHKLKEKEKSKEESSILDNIPKRIPALSRAKLVQERASRVGFDWKDPKEAFPKIYEEIQELSKHLEKECEKSKLQVEIGDLLFAVVNVARLLGIDSERALHQTIEKFIARFKYIEKRLTEENKSLYETDLEEMEKLWQESKKFI